MNWKVEFDAAVGKEFRKLDRTVQQRIQRYLRERVVVADDPRQCGKAMRGTRRGCDATGWAITGSSALLRITILLCWYSGSGRRRDVYRS